MQVCWLVRHGQSASNAGEMTQDAGSTPLTPLGEAQAVCFAEQFTAVPDLIVSSPFRRAQQTAVPLCKRFPDVPTETWAVQEFSGLAPYRYQETTQDVRRQHIHTFWNDPDPHFADEPDGESFAVGLARVADFLERLQSHPAERIVVFSHGRFLQLVYWVWLIQDLERAIARKAQFGAFFKTVWMPNTAVVAGCSLERQLLLSPPNNQYLPVHLRS
ncbi:MAG: histidine phosphatase family protein [Anaerolineales bacterium]|nr:histidine phosphatase family protein [Anaerolineales bacterium]